MDHLHARFYHFPNDAPNFDQHTSYNIVVQQFYRYPLSFRYICLTTNANGCSA